MSCVNPSGEIGEASVPVSAQNVEKEALHLSESQSINSVNENGKFRLQIIDDEVRIIRLSLKWYTEADEDREPQCWEKLLEDGLK